MSRIENGLLLTALFSDQIRAELEAEERRRRAEAERQRQRQRQTETLNPTNILDEIFTAVKEAHEEDRRRYARMQEAKRQAQPTKHECKCEHKCVHTEPICEQTRLIDCIDHVISYGDDTVIFWKDGTTSAVKRSHEDSFDYEKGIAMAVLKGIFGDSYFKDIESLIKHYPHMDSVADTRAESKAKTNVTPATKTKVKPTTKSRTKVKSKTPSNDQPLVKETTEKSVNTETPDEKKSVKTKK